MKTPRSMTFAFLLDIALMLVLAIILWLLAADVPSRSLLSSSLGEKVALPEEPQQAKPARAISPREVPASSLFQRLAAALELIEAEPDFAMREKRLMSLADEIPAGDLGAVVSFFGERDWSSSSQDWSRRLIRRWAKDSPQAAADWVSRMPASPVRLQTINDVAIAWGNQNFPDTVGWLRQIPEDKERQAGLISAAYEAARTEPAEALKVVVELPVSEEGNNLIDHVAYQWAASAPEAAAEWAGQISDATLREHIMSSVATAWGESDPVAAATWALQALPAGRLQEDALVGIVQRWVQTDPEKAAAWVSGFPEGPLRDAAVENLVKLWADKNLEASGHWVNSLKVESNRDVAVVAYVGKLTPAFPEAAARWARLINDETQRSHQLQEVTTAWLASDATAARAWISQAGMPDSISSHLLDALPAENR